MSSPFRICALLGLVACGPQVLPQTTGWAKEACRVVEALSVASASQLPPHTTVLVTVTSASTQALVFSAPSPELDAGGDGDAR